MLSKQLIVGSMGVCCYIVGCEKTGKGAIIDPGGNVENIVAQCTDMNLDIEYIIATHGHADHVCENRLLKEQYQVPIVMHEADAEFFAQKEILQFFSQLGLEHSPYPDILVKDGDTIKIGEETLGVIHTPGHTPGGICLYNEPNLYTGDTLFAGGLGRTDFPGGSHVELMDSIKVKLFKLPDETVVWPGHGYGGNSSTLGEEKHSNPFL